MERYIAWLERLGAQWQKGLDNLRRSPWMIGLLVSIVWGSAGWSLAFYIYKASQQQIVSKDKRIDDKDRRIDNVADRALDAQSEALKAKDAQIELLTEKRTDTTKR